MTTDEVNEDEVFTALVKHRLSDIDPKYVPDDAVANIADAYTEWRSGVERAAAEKALTKAATEVEDLVDGYESTADEMLGRGEWADSNRYSNYSAGLNMAVTKLRARAEAYRQERKEP